MSGPEPLSTELMLKELMRETDKAVAKAQAAMVKVVGKSTEPETTPTPPAVSAEPTTANWRIVRDFAVETFIARFWYPVYAAAYGVGLGFGVFVLRVLIEGASPKLFESSLRLMILFVLLFAGAALARRWRFFGLRMRRGFRS